MAYHEPEYCFNCDNEAVVFVTWVDTNHVEHTTFMCATCRGAFEFGQCTPEPTEYIDN